MVPTLHVSTLLQPSSIHGRITILMLVLCSMSRHESLVRSVMEILCLLACPILALIRKISLDTPFARPLIACKGVSVVHLIRLDVRPDVLHVRCARWHAAHALLAFFLFGFDGSRSLDFEGLIGSSGPWELESLSSELAAKGTEEGRSVSPGPEAGESGEGTDFALSATAMIVACGGGACRGDADADDVGQGYTTQESRYDSKSRAQDREEGRSTTGSA